MKHRQLAVGIERGFRRDEFEYLDTFERPAVTGGDELQLAFRLGKSDVKHLLSLADTFEQKLQGDRGLARPRPALVEIKPVFIEAPVEDGVETGHSARDTRRVDKLRLFEPFCHVQPLQWKPLNKII
jgi:hypothetical protein